MNGKITRKINLHKHRPDPARIEAVRAITAVKRRAVDTDETTAAVLSNGLQGISEASQGALPSMKSVKQSIR